MDYSFRLLFTFVSMCRSRQAHFSYGTRVSTTRWHIPTRGTDTFSVLALSFCPTFWHPLTPQWQPCALWEHTKPQWYTCKGRNLKAISQLTRAQASTSVHMLCDSSKVASIFFYWCSSWKSTELHPSSVFCLYCRSTPASSIIKSRHRSPGYSYTQAQASISVHVLCDSSKVVCMVFFLKTTELHPSSVFCLYCCCTLASSIIKSRHRSPGYSYAPSSSLPLRASNPGWLTEK